MTIDELTALIEEKRRELADLERRRAVAEVEERLLRAEARVAELEAPPAPKRRRAG